MTDSIRPQTPSAPPLEVSNLPPANPWTEAATSVIDLAQAAAAHPPRLSTYYHHIASESGRYFCNQLVILRGWLQESVIHPEQIADGVLSAAHAVGRLIEDAAIAVVTADSASALFGKLSQVTVSLAQATAITQDLTTALESRDSNAPLNVITAYTPTIARAELAVAGSALALGPNLVPTISLPVISVPPSTLITTGNTVFAAGTPEWAVIALHTGTHTTTLGGITLLMASGPTDADPTSDTSASVEGPKRQKIERVGRQPSVQELQAQLKKDLNLAPNTLTTIADVNRELARLTHKLDRLEAALEKPRRDYFQKMSIGADISGVRTAMANLADLRELLSQSAATP